MLQFMDAVTWEAIGKLAALVAIFLVARPAYRLGDHLTTKAIEDDTKDWRRGL